MELTLVGAEDVYEDVVQPEEKTTMEEEITIKEFEVNKELKNLLSDIHAMALGGMDVQGYRSYITNHPRRDHDVTYYVKGKVVIMVDYHGSNAMTVEVLDKKDAEWFINTVKETFGTNELNN